MRVRKQRDAPVRGKQPLDQGLCPRLDVFYVFAFRYPRRPHGPVGIFSADIVRRTAFIDTVVPFAQARLFLCLSTKTCLGAGIASATHRAAQHKVEGLRRKHRPQPTRLFAPVVGQRNVSTAGVLAGKTPFGFTMTDQPDLGLIHVVFGSGSVHWRWQDEGLSVRFRAESSGTCLVSSQFYGAIDKFSEQVTPYVPLCRPQTDSKRSALNGVTSTNGSSPVIMDAISRPVTAPSVSPWCACPNANHMVL